MKRIFKTKSIVQLAAAVVLSLGCMFGFQVNAKAAITAVPTVKQVDANSSAIALSWNNVFDSAGADVYYYTQCSPNVNFAGYTVERSYDGSEVIYNLNAGTTYYVRVGVSTTSQYSGYPSDVKWSAPIKAVTAPSTVASSTFKYVSATATSITTSWGAVPGATGYKVKYYKYGASSDTAKWASTSKNSITIGKLSKNTLYNILVFPCRKDGAFEAVQDYGYGMSALATLPTKISGVDCDYFNPSVKKAYATFEWDANKVADGYQYEIYKYSDTKCRKKLATGYTTYNYATVTKSKLKPRQFYKIRVRAYVNVAGNKKKVGTWSSWEYFARCAGDDMDQELVGEKVKLSWKKVAGAQSYTVYWATKYNGKYSKLTTTKSTTYTINKDLPYYKTYYVRVIPNRKVGKKTYRGVVNSKGYYSSSFYKYKTYSY